VAGGNQLRNNGAGIVDRDGKAIVDPDGNAILDPISVEEACEVVAEKLRGTPCEVSADRLKKIYYKVKNDPNETWRRGYSGVVKRP